MCVGVVCARTGRQLPIWPWYRVLFDVLFTCQEIVHTELGNIEPGQQLSGGNQLNDDLPARKQDQPGQRLMTPGRRSTSRELFGTYTHGIVTGKIQNHVSMTELSLNGIGRWLCSVVG